MFTVHDRILTSSQESLEVLSAEMKLGLEGWAEGPSERKEGRLLQAGKGCHWVELGSQRKATVRAEDVVQLVNCLPSIQEVQFNPKLGINWVWWRSTWEVETGGSRGQRHPQLHGEFRVSLG